MAASRKSRNIFACIFAMSILASSFAAYATDAKDSERYKKGCTNNSDPLMFVASKALNQEVLQTIVKLKDLIHETARKYGIDARVIAGVILAEHSMNTGATDIVENFLVRSGVASTGEIFGKKFTYGFGQQAAKEK